MSIDAGTTGITVLLVDGDGKPFAKAYSEFPQYFPKPGWVEHDPEEIWKATTDVIAKVMQQAPGKPKAIGITNQRETTVLWDRRSLLPVHNAIVWQCRRSAPICDELRSRGVEEEIRSRTGLVLDAYFSGTKLTWLFREIDTLGAKADAGEIAFGTIDSWLIAKLTSGASHLTDPSNASRTMLFNLASKTWDDRLLEILGIPAGILPEIAESSGSFGFSTLAGIEGVPISGVAGDQQSALFGQACFTPGMSKNTFGTGSFVLANTGSDHRVSDRGLLTSVAWELNGVTSYALEGSIFITGAAIQWLRDGLGIIEKASEAEPLATSVADNGGVHFVPALVGLGAPHWKPDARGTITGITRGTTKAHLARAAIEAMAFQTREVVDVMNADSGVHLSELRVDGGAAVMDLLCQFTSDMLGIEVSRPQIPETTAMGAAYLAGLAQGVWKDTSEVASQWKLDRRFEPSIDADQREERFAGWKKAIGATLA